eukprot:319709_1
MTTLVADDVMPRLILIASSIGISCSIDCEQIELNHTQYILWTTPPSNEIKYIGLFINKMNQQSPNKRNHALHNEHTHPRAAQVAYCVECMVKHLDLTLQMICTIPAKMHP